MVSYSLLRTLVKSVFSNAPRLEKSHLVSKRFIKTSTVLTKDDNVKTVVPYDFFANVEKKSKETYLDMVKIFETRDIHRRGHVEFIYAALKHMEEFNVHKDLEAYRALLNVLPKGKFIPMNIFQVEFMHYPKQQQCAIDLLEQMEDNGVIPDYEMEDILINVFGSKGFPLRKFWRMMYWMPKFKNLSPWPVPNPVPNDNFELAKLAIERISSVDLHREVKVYQTKDLEDALDDTWIVSAQSPKQKELLQEQSSDAPAYVEGAFRVWLRDASVNYFILRAEPKPLPPNTIEDTDDVSSLQVPFLSSFATPKKDIVPVPSVHEQDDGIILAVCATGTSSRDSLLSWIRHLEKDGNPALEKVPVLFTLKSPHTGIVPTSGKSEDGEEKKEESSSDNDKKSDNT